MKKTGLKYGCGSFIYIKDTGKRGFIKTYFYADATYSTDTYLVVLDGKYLRLREDELASLSELRKLKINSILNEEI